MKKHERVLVTDSRLLTKAVKTPVLRGAKDILYKQWESKSTTTNSISFSCPPPFEGAEIDRSIAIVVPVRLTLTKADMPYDQYIFNADACNLRSYPIHKAMKSIKITLNNQSLSLNLSNILSALEHYSTSPKLKYLEYSKCATYGTCQAQSFSNLPQGSRSSLASYADSISGIAPQFYPFTVISQTNTALEGGVGLATSVIEFTSIENLMISPLHWGESDSNFQTLKNIVSMDVDIDFVDNCGFRMVAIDNNAGALAFGAGAVTVTSQFSFTVSDNFTGDDLVPKLLVQYIKPQEPHRVPNDLYEINYYQIQERITSHSSNVAADETVIIKSPEILLQQLPSKIWLFARKPTNTFLLDPFTPDCFMALKSVRIMWNGKIVLSGAHAAQIYDISVANGLQLEWSSWSGGKFNAPGLSTSGTTGWGTATNQFAGTGSIACFDVMDFGTSAEMERHPNGSYGLQIDATMKNISEDTFKPELYIVTLTDGLLTIDNGITNTRLGIEDWTFDEKLHGETSQVLRSKSYKDTNIHVPMLLRK